VRVSGSVPRATVRARAARTISMWSTAAAGSSPHLQARRWRAGWRVRRRAACRCRAWSP